MREIGSATGQAYGKGGVHVIQSCGHSVFLPFVIKRRYLKVKFLKVALAAASLSFRLDRCENFAVAGDTDTDDVASFVAARAPSRFRWCPSRSMRAPRLPNRAACEVPYHTAKFLLIEYAATRCGAVRGGMEDGPCSRPAGCANQRLACEFAVGSDHKREARIIAV